MNKTYTTFILIGLLVILSISLIFTGQGYYKYKKYYKSYLYMTATPLHEITRKAVTLVLQDEEKLYSLTENDEAVIVSKTLQPTFVIKQNQKITDLKFYFDDFEEDLLGSKFSNATIKDDGDLKIRFEYTLEPQRHKITIKYSRDNQELIEEYKFLLILFDDFSEPLNQSKLWGLADSAKLHNNWEIKEGRLLAHPLSSEADPSAISSLFFIRRFQGDFFIQFDFTPQTKVISFLPYLFQRGLNFVFGSNGYKNVIVLNKPGAQGEFVFEPLKTYRVRLIRKENIYKIFVTPNRSFSEKDLILAYEDKEQLHIPFDAFGFTIWSNSGGIQVDNFYVANEDISNVFNFYDLEESEE